MPSLISHPDDVNIELREGETLLEAAIRAQLPLAHVCGGKGRCSTCRVWVLDGLDSCPQRNEREQGLAEQLSLDRNIRLACQLRPNANLEFRRLVLDETDMVMTNQIARDQHNKAGELKDVAVFFSDIIGFTPLSENLLPYDVMYLLNRYFAQTGEVIEANFGYIDKFVGDGMMAIFGIDGRQDSPIRAVNAGLQCLAVVDRMKPFIKTMYDIDFEVRIGVHWGEAVIGSVGSPGNEKLTAIGDVVNVASRVESANKEAGTRFLITEALHEKVKDQVEISDFVRMKLPGTSQRSTLYEIKGLSKDVAVQLNSTTEKDTIRYAGRNWSRLIATADMSDGDRRIFEFPDFDLAVLRRKGRFFAFNNACPHVNLPFFNRCHNIEKPEKLRPDESETVGDEVTCRWHNSRFDLATGEVVRWCEALSGDGTSEGMEQLGDISKNRTPLRLFPTRVEDGLLWVTFDS